MCDTLFDAKRAARDFAASAVKQAPKVRRDGWDDWTTPEGVVAAAIARTRLGMAERVTASNIDCIHAYRAVTVALPSQKVRTVYVVQEGREVHVRDRLAEVKVLARQIADNAAGRSPGVDSWRSRWACEASTPIKKSIVPVDSKSACSVVGGFEVQVRSVTATVSLSVVRDEPGDAVTGWLFFGTASN